MPWKLVQPEKGRKSQRVISVTQFIKGMLETQSGAFNNAFEVYVTEKHGLTMYTWSDFLEELVQNQPQIPVSVWNNMMVDGA